MKKKERPYTLVGAGQIFDLDEPTGIAFIDTWANLVRRHGHATTAWYARQMGLEPRQFSAMIEGLTGHSPGYLMDYYLVRSARELLKEGRQMKEVGRLLGFKNLDVFSKYWRNKTK